MLPVYVLTNDNHSWLLPGFCHLLRTFWPGQRVTVVGYGKPPTSVHYPFWSIDSWNWPVERWSDSLIWLLDRIPDERFILLLEDYWLTGHVKTRVMLALYDWMHEQPDLLSLDLSIGPRMCSHWRTEYQETVCGARLFAAQPDGEFLLRFSPTIWNRDLLRQFLVPGETPWQVERNGSERVREAGVSVLGVFKQQKVFPFSAVYCSYPAYRKKVGGRGKYARQPGLRLNSIPHKHLAVLSRRKLIRRG